MAGLKGHDSDLPKVVIITPVFNEEENLPRYIERVSEVLFPRADYQFNILFVDDGSVDSSWKIIKATWRRDQRFTGIRLSRNYGSHVAMSAGFAHTDGDCICTLACDLQDPPEVILRFLEKWKTGVEIVWGKRKTREDSLARILASNLFSRLIRRFAMPKGSLFTTGSFLLADRKVAECFRQFHESNRVTFALVAWTGFEQDVVEYDRLPRTAGKSGWNFGRMVKAMYDAFIGFSFLPVRLITFTGICVSLIAVALMFVLFINWLSGSTLVGWTSIMAGLAFFFGVQFLLMGIVGEYLFRIYAEVVRRPLYFVSEKTDPPTLLDTVASKTYSK